MKVVKIYLVTWIVVLGLTGGSYSMGLLNEITFPIFGLVLGTLAAAGLLAVLPVWLNEHFLPKRY